MVDFLSFFCHAIPKETWIQRLESEALEPTGKRLGVFLFSIGRDASSSQVTSLQFVDQYKHLGNCAPAPPLPNSNTNLLTYYNMLG